MPRIALNLTDEQKRFIDCRIAEGQGNSPEQFVASLLQERMDQTREPSDSAELEQELLKGLEGTATPMTKARWDAIERRALPQARPGKTLQKARRKRA